MLEYFSLVQVGRGKQNNMEIYDFIQKNDRSDLGGHYIELLE